MFKTLLKKRINMFSHTFFYLFFLIITAQTFYANELDEQTKKQILKILNTNENNPNVQQKFANILHEHPEIISTVERPGLAIINDQTAAHFCANNRNYIFLTILLNAGETAAAPITITTAQYAKSLGSTAFLSFCFQMKNLSNNVIQRNHFLYLLEKFAQRTPRIIIMPRCDGMTPAGAIACSNSSIKDQVLYILAQNHPQAFFGITKNDPPQTVAELLLKTPPSHTSCNALRIILNHQKAYNSDLFEKNLTTMANRCAKNYKENNYLSIILTFMSPELKKQMHDDLLNKTNCISDQQRRACMQNIIHNHCNPCESTEKEICLYCNPSRLTELGRCLCCLVECNCCTYPIKELEHYEYWYEFYSRNPTDQNAQAWFQKYNAIRNR